MDPTPYAAPDTPGEEGWTLRNAARLALDRAHRAARALDGGELRRSLEDALDNLKAACGHPDATGPSRSAADKIARALVDLDGGPLDEAERLIEQARSELGQEPEDAPAP